MFGALKRGRFRSLASLSYTCSECCWRTSTEKNTCGIARFPCGSTAFLFLLVVTYADKTSSKSTHPRSVCNSWTSCVHMSSSLLSIESVQFSTLLQTIKNHNINIIQGVQESKQSTGISESYIHCSSFKVM